MRRFLVSALACALAGCADRPATAIVAAVAADHDTLGVVRSIRLRAYRGSELRHELILPPETLDHPGTLTYRDHTDGDSKETLRFVVDGLATPPPVYPDSQPSYGAPGQAAPGLSPQAGTLVDDSDPAVLVRRSARLPFVKEKTKLLRLGLSASCLGVPCEQATETCKAGRCVDDKEDPGALPDASGDLGGIDYGGFSDLPDGTGGAAGSSSVQCQGESSAQDVYVDAKAPGGCFTDLSCGNKANPFCSLDSAMLLVKAKLTGGNHVTLHLAATSGDDVYEGHILLPAGVDLVGGYEGSWQDPPTGTTRIRPATGKGFVEDTISTANSTHVRSTIAVADSSAGNSVLLSHLTVEMASDDVVTEEQAKLETETYLTAGIHLPGSASAELRGVRVLGKPGAALNESTEGVYVSSGGTASVTLYGSTIAPPASTFGRSSAVTIDEDAGSAVVVCESTLTGGRAEFPGRTSAGLRALGGSSIFVQSDCTSEFTMDTVVAGGFGWSSQGIFSEGPGSLTFKGGPEVLGVQPADGQTWPAQVKSVAAVVVNLLRTTKVTVENSTLIGLKTSAALSAPKDTIFYGLRVVPYQDKTPLTADLSLDLSGATLQGVGSLLSPGECDSAYGLSLVGPTVLATADTAPKVTVSGGSILGGGACRNRKGAQVANLDILMGTSTSFKGSTTSLDCASAVGLSVESTLAIGTVVNGGQYVGGDGCRERVGVRAGGASSIENLTATGGVGDSDKDGLRLVGVEVVDGVDASASVATKVTGCTMTGGTMNAQASLPDKLVYAAGLRLALERGAEVTGNSVITGCVDCQGSMFAAGVRVDRPSSAGLSTITIKGNKSIIGASFAVDGTPATEARVDGILVQGFADLNDTNKALSGGAFGQNLNVIMGPTDGGILGVPASSTSTLLPGASTGVTIRGGGVTVQGAAGALQTIESGNALQSAVGVRICDEDGFTSTACKDGNTNVLHVQATGGAAVQSAGLSAQRVYGLVVDGVVARPGPAAAGQTRSRGIWLRDRNTGIIGNSYFFGLSPSPNAGNVEDRACSLELDGVGTPDKQEALIFAHNACVAGGAGPLSIGLYMDEFGVASEHRPVTVANNLLAVGDSSPASIAWLRSRTNPVDASTQGSSLTLSSNLVFASSQGRPLGLTPKGFPSVDVCSKDPNSGYLQCSASATSYLFENEFGSPMAPTNNQLYGAPPGTSPYDGIYDPATWMMNGQCAATLGVGPVVTGNASTGVLAEDFLGNPRTSPDGEVSRGPIVCTYGGGG